MRLPRILALAGMVGMAACETEPTSFVDVTPESETSLTAQERIGPGVLDAVRDGGARVIVALAFATDATAGVPGASLDLATLRAGVSAAQRDVLARLTEDDFAVSRRFQAVPAFAGIVRTEDALARLAADTRVRRVDLDIGGTGLLDESVPHIDADLRHGVGNTGEGVVVAVLDTGVDTNHPDIGTDLVAEACFGDDDGAIDGAGFCPGGGDRETGAGSAEDDAGHGTHVSGIITSDGTVSSPGVAPDADLVAIKVLNNCSFSGCFSFTSEIVAALDYIIATPALGVDVINMSIGTNALYTGTCDNTDAITMSVAAAINTLRTNGVIAFAAAGNNGSSTQMPLPACVGNVMSVGSADLEDDAAASSNSNSTTDIFAPGVGITSLAVGGGTTGASGTSMASPHAAGCAALLIEAGDATTPAQIETRLETSPFTVTVAANSLSFPRIDCSPDFNLAPEVDAGGPYAGVEGGPIVLSPTAADPDGDALNYTWTVDSGLCTFSNPNILAPTLTCADNGVFTIELTATDGDLSDDASATVSVANLDPVITAFDVAPADIIVGQSVTATGSFTDVPADVLTAGLDWDDGATSPVHSPFSVDHTYLVSGDYVIELTVLDDDGGMASGTRSVTVLSPAAAIMALKAQIEALDLDDNTENSMVSLLMNALASVEAERSGPAILQLEAFINQVQSQSGKKIDETDAAALIAYAEAIIAALEAGLS